jgi:hypothetical protein
MDVGYISNQSMEGKVMIGKLMKSLIVVGVISISSVAVADVGGCYIHWSGQRLCRV